MYIPKIPQTAIYHRLAPRPTFQIIVIEKLDENW